MSSPSRPLPRTPLLPRSALVALLLVASAAIAACSAEPTDDGASGADAIGVLDDDAPLVKNGRDEPIAVPAEGTMLTELAQPELLARLNREGYAFANVVGAPDRLTNAELARQSAVYAQIADAVTADVDEMKRADPTLTTKVVTGKGRAFDTGWLRSKWATFELVGVVNRIDRKDVQADGRCGELRFVYRLAYVKTTDRVPSFSRLPFAFNVVYDVRGPSCADAAKRWQATPGDRTPDGYVTWLKEGVLDLKRVTLKQIELNAQVLRIPSESKADMGGVAEYFLRVYRPKDGGVAIAPLENTPDVKRISADPALRAELLQWIKSNVRAIDQGTAVMPDKFAATKGLSSTTFGSARSLNKLFSQLYKPSDLGDLGLEGTKLVGSPEGLLFRLDDMTCVGCHQGSSVAGFHLLGTDRATRMNPLNGLRVHGSPHFFAELERRAAYLHALASGGQPEQLRPTSFDPAGATATVGMHCVVDGDRSHFKRNWQCEQGTTCKALATNARSPITMGQCLPTAGGFAGLPCIKGAVTDASNPRADKLAMENFGCVGAYVCLTPEQGTPGGLCVNHCKGALGASNGPNEICAYGASKTFDTCAMSSNFAACIGTAVAPSARQSCDETRPCREDYMCQRLEQATGDATFSTTPKGKGFCNPTYFIFQMRLDGHPSPDG